MKFEIWPGPMEGIGKGGFIAAVNQLKLIPRWMTPFVRLSQELPRRSKLKEFYSAFAASEVPVCVQLMGVDPVLLAQAGSVFMELGAESLNLNFGCPSSRVTSGKAGGGALKAPEMLKWFCAKVKDGLPPETSLSVKLRCGWKDPQEMEKILPSIVQSGAVSKIFFHYRTVKELYFPLPHEERVKRFKRAVELADGIPVVINGDISSVDEAAAPIPKAPWHSLPRAFFSFSPSRWPFAPQPVFLTSRQWTHGSRPRCISSSPCWPLFFV